jgi:hypothetical protein
MATDERRARQRDLQLAEARYRSVLERYFPLPVLGARPALPMTAEAQLMLARLATERDAAIAALEATA